ncbi:MAG TPA: ATP/GTP-binding protein [Arenicellales bacterium]|nr:ATP/GTP-binding protein [Arenicellales bacterium]
MTPDGEIKIVFSGTMGSGKTTAIANISDVPPVSTEALTTDEGAAGKTSTTAAMDYGEVDLGDDLVLRLYGTPGQRRFRHMWELLVPGALGVVILVDNARPLPLSDVAIYLDNFAGLVGPSGVVIGITKTDMAPEPSIAEYHQFLAERNESYTVLAVDVRKRDDVLMMIDVLLTSVEGALQ